jgi:trimeric autotransporter adhesin
MFHADIPSAYRLCACSGCSSSSEKNEPPGFAAYSVTGDKWGSSASGGSFGGVITWSVMAAGLADETGNDIFTGLTASFAAQLSFDYAALMRSAFAAWSQVANLSFIEIADGGGGHGAGADAQIRIALGEIDPGDSTLGLSFFPFGGGGYAQDNVAGDIAIDTATSDPWTPGRFYLVMLHEIGHSLGLDHEQTTLALMNPIISETLYNTGPFGTSLQQDDIDGIRAVYGAAAAGPKVHHMEAGRANLAMLSNTGSILVEGNALANTITGTTAAETLIGAAGADTLSGGDGADVIHGDFENAGAAAISLGTGTVTKTAGQVISSAATAINLSNQFSLAANGEIENATLVPHVTVNATTSTTAGLDFYRVQINNPGAVITVDIDGTAGLDTCLQLRNGTGAVLGEFDDALTSYGAAGSTNRQDSYFNIRVPAAGDYYIVLGKFDQANNSGIAVPAGGQPYRMHVSVAGEMMTGEAGDSIDGGGGLDRLFGGGGSDVLLGGTGNDTLDGGSGGDTMNGGSGDDLFYADNAQDSIVEAAGEGADLAYVTGYSGSLAHVESVVVYGSGAVNATGDAGVNVVNGAAITRLAGFSYSALAGNDVLYGSNYADTLLGGADNDILIGYASVGGQDSLAGGAGDDVYYVFEADDILLELAGEGFDTVYAYANITFSANIEQAILVGSGITATGNGLANNIFGNNLSAALTLDGGAGNDWLIGGTGGDTLLGGADNDILQGLIGANRLDGGTGDDQFFSASATDTIIEAAGQGLDTLYTTYSVTGLAANVEQLSVSGGATVANGNALANAIYANNNSVGTSINAEAGSDVVYGSGFADTIFGGAGNDRLQGAGGADRFAYAAGHTGADLILDFADGSDLIQLTGLGYSAGQIGSAITLGGGANALITFASGSLAGTTITLLSVHQSSIAAADFVF